MKKYIVTYQLLSVFGNMSTWIVIKFWTSYEYFSYKSSSHLYLLNNGQHIPKAYNLLPASMICPTAESVFQVTLNIIN